MTDHLLAWLAGIAAGIVAAVAASLATRVQLLPEVVDIIRLNATRPLDVAPGAGPELLGCRPLSGRDYLTRDLTTAAIPVRRRARRSAAVAGSAMRFRGDVR